MLRTKSPGFERGMVIEVGEKKTRKAGWNKGWPAMAGIWFLLAAGILAGCGKKPVFEGGNISVDYDANKWTLECCSLVEYPVFELWWKDVSVTFLAVKGSENAIDNFYEAMTDQDVMYDEGRQSQQVDAWSRGSARCYTNAVSGGVKGEKMGDSTMMCYGRTKGEWVILAMAEFQTKDSDSENEARKQEIMEILNSIGISQKTSVEGVEEKKTLEPFYTSVSRILDYSTSADLAREEGEKESAPERKLTAEEAAAPLQYVAQYMVGDLLGGEILYPVFAPVDSDDSDSRFLAYHGHGIHFSASANNSRTRFYLYQYFERVSMGRAEEWQLSELYRDIEAGEVQANGEDRYLLLSAVLENGGRTYGVKDFFYLDVQGEGTGVLWQLELEEGKVDKETNLIIDELSKCYGVCLDGLKVDGE